jgi:hypothetical protein
LYPGLDAVAHVSLAFCRRFRHLSTVAKRVRCRHWQRPEPLGAAQRTHRRV